MKLSPWGQNTLPYSLKALLAIARVGWHLRRTEKHREDGDHDR